MNPSWDYGDHWLWNTNWVVKAKLPSLPHSWARTSAHASVTYMPIYPGYHDVRWLKIIVKNIHRWITEMHVTSRKPDWEYFKSVFSVSMWTKETNKYKHHWEWHLGPYGCFFQYWLHCYRWPEIVSKFQKINETHWTQY